MLEESRPHLIKPHVTQSQMCFGAASPTDNIKDEQCSGSGLEQVAKGTFQ